MDISTELCASVFTMPKDGVLSKLDHGPKGCSVFLTVGLIASGGNMQKEARRRVSGQSLHEDTLETYLEDPVHVLNARKMDFKRIDIRPASASGLLTRDSLNTCR